MTWVNFPGAAKLPSVALHTVGYSRAQSAAMPVIASPPNRCEEHGKYAIQHDCHETDLTTEEVVHHPSDSALRTGPLDCARSMCRAKSCGIFVELPFCERRGPMTTLRSLMIAFFRCRGVTGSGKRGSWIYDRPAFSLFFRFGR